MSDLCAPSTVHLLTGQRLTDWTALRRRLRADPNGAVHRGILAWLELPVYARPPTLRRLRRRQPSRQATCNLLRMVSLIARAYALFGDLELTRRWLSTPRSFAGDPKSFPLATLANPSHRRALAAALRRTAHGIY